MKIYVMAPEPIRNALVETFQTWGKEQGHSITNTLFERLRDSRADSQQRWKDMGNCEVGVFYTALPPTHVELYTEMGILMGWARHIIVMGGSGGMYSHLPWVIHIPWDPSLSNLTEAMKNLTSRFHVKE